jgi:hypothetical protein
VEVLRFLIESISDLLDGFGTQIEKLEEQLAEGFYSPGGNAWSAAHVSLGEQRVLRLTRKTTEDLLATVESGSGNERGLLSAPPQCAKCEKVSVQLMRFAEGATRLHTAGGRARSPITKSTRRCVELQLLGLVLIGIKREVLTSPKTNLERKS